MNPATISLRTVPPRVLLRLRGEVDISAVADVRAAVVRAVAGGCRDIDLDLADVSFMDCAGVGVVLWCREHAERSGGRLTLTHVSPSVARILALTGHDRGLKASDTALVSRRQPQPM